jgi:hypothetical protein
MCCVSSVWRINWIPFLLVQNIMNIRRPWLRFLGQKDNLRAMVLARAAADSERVPAVFYVLNNKSDTTFDLLLRRAGDPTKGAALTRSAPAFNGSAVRAWCGANEGRYFYVSARSGCGVDDVLQQLVLDLLRARPEGGLLTTITSNQ